MITQTNTNIDTSTITNSLLAVVINFLQQHNWSFSQHATEPILKMSYQGENGEWLCTAKTREEHRQFIFYSSLPVSVPENKRLAVTEFLTRANFGLIVGNFEMDLQDGELRYKTYSIEAEGCNINPDLIGQLIFANLMIMDRYLPGIMSVIYANVAPELALKQVEG
ncbi:YbjN domain-containing protein [Nostoc sp. FACHB-110]|uniref:YbjN domain-containing protein n=1 Tax=Nostoc sp. FACHB-110 TaxID=2692834 RepID=UPI001685A4BA|nr:YbjN domain-containing protein [Nostoc sp. FACHB-110]MBD2436570.1 YbjN domain-containing protein [Nostoc sp. FACHB-110]